MDPLSGPNSSTLHQSEETRSNSTSRSILNDPKSHKPVIVSEVSCK